MKNLKITLKLALAFGLILISVCFLGVTSLTNLKSVSSVVDEVTDVNLPVIDQLWVARRSLVALQREILIEMRSTNQAEYDAVQKTLEKESASL